MVTKSRCPKRLNYDFDFNGYQNIIFSMFPLINTFRNAFDRVIKKIKDSVVRHKSGHAEESKKAKISRSSQSRIIISTNLVGPTSPILHAKSQGHWLSGSSEEF